MDMRWETLSVGNRNIKFYKLNWLVLVLVFGSVMSCVCDAELLKVSLVP